MIACVHFSPTAVATDIYRHEDAQGRTTYSDTVIPELKQIKIPSKNYRYLHQVARIYDGDTITLKNGQRVRLLGINTPEVEGYRKTDEPGGIAAKEWLQLQLKNKKVYLEFDQVKHDRYKRLLAHIYLPNGQHLNASLLENGLATINIMPPNLRHVNKLIKAQQQAEKKGLGIWSMSEYNTRPLTQITGKPRGWKRYLGTPKSIKQSRKYTRLIFNNQVDIRIANHNLAIFPKLDTYLGKLLEIRGWVSRKRKHYSILIHHPSALILQ